MRKVIETYGKWGFNFKKTKSKILATEMYFLRRSCSVSRLQHIRNEDIKRGLAIEESVIEEIEKKNSYFGMVTSKNATS